MPTNDYVQFREAVRSCRVCHIGGSFVGKTAMAVILALDFQKEGYRLSANFNLSGADQLNKIFALDKNKQHCVILEIGGVDLVDENRANALLDHIASRDMVVLIPCATLPHDRLRVLTCDVWKPYRPKWLPRSSKPLECAWKVTGATYPGSCGRFRWRIPDEIYHMYNSRDPGHRSYMDGYSAFVWQQTLRQAIHDLDSPITVDDFDILVRPGQIFMLCLWLHSQLVYLLALKQSSEKEREKFRNNPHYTGSITGQRGDLQRMSLGPAISKFKTTFKEELTGKDHEHLTGLNDLRNSFAHGFFSLDHLENKQGFVSYASNREGEQDTVRKLFTSEEDTQKHISAFLELGKCFNRLCRNMDIDYDRIL